MVRVGFPRRLVLVVRLVSPIRPARPCAAGEQLEVGAARAAFDNGVLLVRLARVLAFARLDHVHLPPSRRQRPRVLAARAEQKDFGDVAEIEPDTAPVRAAVLADLVPDDVALVIEAPRLHHRKSLRQQGVRRPEIKVRGVLHHVGHGQCADVVGRQGFIARQPAMFRCDLASAVGEAPRRVGQHRMKSPPAQGRGEIDDRLIELVHRPCMPLS